MYICIYIYTLSLCPFEVCIVFILSSSQTTIFASCSFPPLAGWGQNRRKARLMNQDNDNLIKKANLVHTNKAKRGINLVLPISRQIFNFFLAFRTLV